MSEENDDLGNEGEGIKNLRKEFEALKKQNAEKDALLSKYQQQERQSTVAAVLKAKGLPDKAASLYTGDDVSEDAVGKWIESYADVFGAQSTQQTSENDANAQAAQRTASAAFDDQGTGTDSVGQVFGDPEEAAKLMRTLPYEELQKRGWVPSGPGLFSR